VQFALQLRLVKGFDACQLGELCQLSGEDRLSLFLLIQLGDDLILRRPVRLVSRNGRDHTERFADIAAAISRLPARTLILDGEVCAFDAQLISHIYLLEPNPEEPSTPPVYMAFDCLYRNGRDLRGKPLSHRREALEDVVGDGRHVYAARRLNPHGLDAWAEVKQRNYEGLVAKRETSSSG
jgi:bifunctional non-homologous end joining protein LigD